MTKWKTKIELPDDSYLPENIDLKDTYFSTYNEAQNHVMDQKDILINWMRNDESCNKPLVIQSEEYDCYPDGGSCYTVILNEECKCKFKVIKEEDTK